MNNKKLKSIITITLILIIIIGIIITSTIGLNFSSVYTSNERLYIYIYTNFNLDDIEQISKEVFGKEKVSVQASYSNARAISITASNISDEQEDSIIQKINEKYSVTIDKTKDIQLEKNANVRGRDIVYPYIYPIALSTIVCLIYLAIRFKKIGLIKVPVIVGALLVLTQVIYISVLAITRIPINRLTMPISLSIYIITMFASTIKLEKMLENRKEKKKDRKQKEE